MLPTNFQAKNEETFQISAAAQPYILFLFPLVILFLPVGGRVRGGVLFQPRTAPPCTEFC